MAVEMANDENFENLLSKNEKVVVQYFANWCGSCRLFKPTFKRLSEDLRFGDMLFLEVNAEESPETRKMAVVQNLPYFAVFKQGVLLEGISTNQEDKVVALIKKLKS